MFEVDSEMVDEETSTLPQVPLLQKKCFMGRNLMENAKRKFQT